MVGIFNCPMQVLGAPYFLAQYFYDLIFLSSTPNKHSLPITTTTLTHKPSHFFLSHSSSLSSSSSPSQSIFMINDHYTESKGLKQMARSQAHRIQSTTFRQKIRIQAIRLYQRHAQKMGKDLLIGSSVIKNLKKREEKIFWEKVPAQHQQKSPINIPTVQKEPPKTAAPLLQHTQFTPPSTTQTVPTQLSMQPPNQPSSQQSAQPSQPPIQAPSHDNVSQTLDRMLKFGQSIGQLQDLDDRSALRTFQSHPKNLQAILKSGEEFRAVLQTMNGEGRLRMVKMLIDCIKSWMLCGQKERIDELPPKQNDAQIYKNSIFCFSLLINSCLIHSKSLRYTAICYLLFQIDFLFKNIRLSAYKDLPLFHHWMAKIDSAGVTPVLYSVRLDQMYCLLFSLLLFTPGRINKLLAERTGQRPLPIEKQEDDSSFWLIINQLLKKRPSFSQPILLFNLVQCLSPCLSMQKSEGPFFKLLKKVGRRLNEQKSVYEKDPELELLQELHEDGELFEKILVTRILRLVGQLIRKIQQEGGDKSKWDSLYFFELRQEN